MLLSVDLAPALHRNSAWNSYFGTTRWLPPGAPGGGITGIMPFPGGDTVIPGSVD